MTFKTVVIGVLVLGLLVRGDEFTLIKYINETADPCEDFYEYACGNFKNVHPLMSDILTIDHFTLLEDQLTYLLNSILSTEEKWNDPISLKKVKSAYKSCIDSPGDGLIPETVIVDSEGGFPLVEATDPNYSSKYEWNDIADAMSKYGVPMIFGIRVNPNVVNATKNLLYIFGDTLQNPTLLKPHQEHSYEQRLEKDFIEKVTRKPQQFKENKPFPFDVFLRKMAFKLKRNARQPASDEEIERRIEVMSDFMRGIATGGLIPENVTIKNLPDYTATLGQLNEWTQQHFQDSTQMDWVDFMRRVFQNTGVSIDSKTEIMTYRGLEKYMYGILYWVKTHSAETVKNFVMMRVFLYMAPDSDAETRDAFEEYYRQKNYVLYPRWKYCTRQVTDPSGSVGLSLALAYEYQLRYFNVNAFQNVLQMIKYLQNSFKKLLTETPWMDDEMKYAAITKLKNMITIMGYPDFITDTVALDQFYENLRICKWDHYGNAQRIRAFKFAYQLSQLSKRNRAFWNISPFETNAYYSRQNNRIIIPVAMLNPEFFGSSNQILNYARIGSIIGHEITHGFDVEGQKFDKDGSLRPWSTHSNFSHYSKCFVEQYDNYYIPEIKSYVNGKNTLNENIADNGGVKESYRAMRHFIKQLNLKLEDSTKFSTDQLFFLGFGTMWCSNPSEKLLMKMKNDVHSVSKWRVNGVVSNMVEFSKAFKCPVGTQMNPSKKCVLW